MIQRIQSLYLLLASGSFGATFLAPFAGSDARVPGTVLADARFDATDSVGMIVGFALAAAAALAAIFLFRNRQLQSRVTLVAILAAAAAVVLGVVAFMQDGAAMGATEVDERAGAVLPLLGIVTAVLGRRGIARDERLVRSADRLR